MNTFEEDNKLREILKGLKPESPGKDFTMNVLDRIHKEAPFAFQVKKEPVLGKGFWIITILFALLGIVMFAMNGSVAVTEGIIGNFLKSVDTGAADHAYRGLISRVDSIPAGIIGILTATSLLIFLERFLEGRRTKS